MDCKAKEATEINTHTCDKTALWQAEGDRGTAKRSSRWQTNFCCSAADGSNKC